MSAAAGKKGFPLDVRISFLPLCLIFLTQLIISEAKIKVNTFPKISGGFHMFLEKANLNLPANENYSEFP